MDGQNVGCTDEWMNGRMSGWKWTKEWLKGQMVDEGMNDWKGEWLEKWMNERRYAWMT